MPMRGELPTVTTRSYVRASTVKTAWAGLLATVCDPDLHCVVIFCAIGLLATINVMLRFPDFGQVAAALAIFP